MQKVVGVKFRSSPKVYIFSCNGLALEVNQDVIVDSSLGLSYGTVASIEKEINEKEFSEPLKNVVRVATNEDKKKFAELQEKATKSLVIVKEKVEKLGLEMKIVSCEYTFDASKIIIEFSADERVDFRELLKELASALKVRIELHQVGQRDEVKIKGGIGPCGEICCCVRFLKEFEHVTVKMAKNQGLSLSPSKISGLCGRLMCCLAYENKTYEEILKKMPKVNSEIMSPKGKGTVVYNDILRERVSIKIKNADESFTVYDFGLEELGKNEQIKSEQTANGGKEKIIQKAESLEDKNVKDNKIGPVHQKSNPDKENNNLKDDNSGGKKSRSHHKNKYNKKFNKKKDEDKNGIHNNR